MRAIVAAIVALGLAGCERGREASEPPARYQADTAAIVSFIDPAQIAHACAGSAHEAGVSVIACTLPGGVVMPNPCQWPGSDPYAQVACHELGHVNGWPADHPR